MTRREHRREWRGRTGRARKMGAGGSGPGRESSGCGLGLARARAREPGMGVWPTGRSAWGSGREAAVGVSGCELKCGRTC